MTPAAERVQQYQEDGKQLQKNKYKESSDMFYISFLRIRITPKRIYEQVERAKGKELVSLTMRVI